LVLGGLKRPLGPESNDREGVAVVVRITVADSAAAGDLSQRLLERVDAATVSFDPERSQVCIEVGGHADQALVRALDATEEWLGSSGGEAITVEVDGRSYVMQPPAQVAASR
jgi:hypothetical protein